MTTHQNENLQINATVLAILHYSSETWTLTKSDNRRLETTHHQWLTRIFCISWKGKVTNEEFGTRCQQSTEQKSFSQHCLKWSGHVIRMQQDRPAKNAFHWNPEDKCRCEWPYVFCTGWTVI